MELIFPTLEHKQAAWDFRQEHIEHGDGFIHGSQHFMSADTYEDWLQAVTLAQTEAPSGFVTGSVYFAMEGSTILGTIAVRDYLNESLLVSGGNIGYGIRPSQRGKGHGRKMLALALDKCRERGMEKVLITCDKDNVGSARTAMANGGKLAKEVTQENGGIMQHYWIAL